MMFDIQTISFVVAGISVTIGAIYYISTLRSTYRGRQALILSSLQSRIDTPEFWERYIDIVFIYSHMSNEEYRKEVFQNKKKGAQVMSVISTFYHIGWLVRMGLLDIKAVMGLTFDVVAVYDVVLPHLVQLGKEQGQPFNEENYPYFTYLYDEIKKRREKIQKKK